MTMTRGCGVTRCGRSRVRHARKAASASARAKREHSRVRETAVNRQLPWLLPLPLPLPLPCRRDRRRPDVPAPQRPLPAATPDADRGGTSPRATRRRRARSNGTPLPSTRPRYLLAGAKKQAQKTPPRVSNR